jgi:AraC-like DNA-binding protein
MMRSRPGGSRVSCVANVALAPSILKALKRSPVSQRTPRRSPSRSVDQQEIVGCPSPRYEGSWTPMANMRYLPRRGRAPPLTKKTHQRRRDRAALTCYHYVPYELASDFPFWCNRTCIIRDRVIVTLHSHNFLEIGYCREGSGIFVVAGKILPFRSGDVSIIAREEVHQAQSTKGTTSRWSVVFLDISRLVDPHFPGCLDVDISRYAGPGFTNILHEKDYPHVCKTVRALVDEAETLDAKGRILVKSLVAQFAVYLDRELPQTSAPRRLLKPYLIERLKPAIEHVMSAYWERISIPLLARMCCMSPRNFSRLFRKALDKSPQQHVMEVRFAMACNQLRTTADPISKVALDNGFPTISSFNRMFRKRIHQTPRQWRDLREQAPKTPRSRRTP